MAKDRLPSDVTKPLPAREAGVIPPPQSHLNTTMTLLAAGMLLHRVHNKQYQASQFNPGSSGNARFSPIKTEAGAIIPTLYGGTTKECAFMETLFHDVPYAPGLKTLDKNKLTDQVHSTIEITAELKLVDLTSIALRKLGITRKELIDTEKDQYPATRSWAEAFYRQCPDAQGLSWISRQDDTARAIVLFGNRIAVGALQQVGTSRSLTEDSATYDDVLELASRLDVLIVPGKK